MSIVDDQIRRIDTLLDRYSIAPVSPRRSSFADSENIDLTITTSNDDTTAAHLKATIRSLSTTSSSKPLLKRRRLRNLISEIQHNRTEPYASSSDTEHLVWLATAKATVQLYGIVLSSLLQQTIPLSESMWYWDDVLGSHIRTGLYMLQTSPIRFFNASQEVYQEAKTRYQSNLGIHDAAQQSGQSIAEGWREFYSIVRDSIRDRSLVQARIRILSPYAMSRTEVRQKQEKLKRLREQSATAIGLLMDEGLNFPHAEYEHLAHDEWRNTVARSVTILETILHHSRQVDSPTEEYQYQVVEEINAAEHEERPAQLAKRLLHILDSHLPQQERSTKRMATEFGMPSRWVRYWIPGLVLVLSGSTLLRIFANRRAEIMTWVRDLGQTTVDFWYNWVVEPTKKLIGTIRHDQNAELAIMSKDSLRSDQESLERMVVDFAVEHPGDGRAYNNSEIAEIRRKVREGDLTPVLRVYEQDLKSPVVKAVTGNLVQALLIQIQKTKVDVEVAIGGIDSLLKSQELLFGFVGVAPGILLSYFVAQWFRGIFGGRRGVQQTRQKGETVRLLRNIDRTLTNAIPAENGMLQYKDHGLLVCEVHVLRQRATAVLPGKIQREFLEDLQDLLDVRTGISRQIKVVERIHWAYSKWLK